MFTGIIRQIGTVREVRATAGGKRVSVDLGPLAEGLQRGDSVAVAGACLTVAELADRAARFDVEAETLRRTTLGAWRAGTQVNLELALRPDDRLDGHIVQGHVDGVAEVREIRTGGQWLVGLAAARELTDQMVEKGSVAIDGVSLTLVEVSDGAFSVALIPETLAATTLAWLAVGDTVNVEADVLGKYVRRYLAQLAQGAPDGAGRVTLAKLKETGFM